MAASKSQYDYWAGEDPADAAEVQEDLRKIGDGENPCLPQNAACECCILGTRCVCISSLGSCVCDFPYECASGTL